ncbi:MAG: divalent metal cation transporter [Actinobacteria bacterium]|nr:divalent metal cation transporter [Actinomycetota bacterium]
MSAVPVSPPPAPRRRRYVRPAAILGILGPGLIAANAGNDAGGIATYAEAGALFEYRTLFICVCVIVALVAVQEMAARVGAYSGEGLMSLVREQFSLRLGAFAVCCLLVANLGLVVSEFAGIGAALEIFGVSRYVSVPIAVVVILGVVLFGSYRYAERVFLVLSLVFLTYPVAMILADPDWGDVVSNALIPHFVADRDFLLIAVALVGTTITPYMQLYQAAAVADRGIGPEDYRNERIDAVFGALFAGFIFVSVLIATAATIGGTGGITSAANAAQALEPVAGQRAEALFAIGLLGASMLAAAIVPLSTAYGLAEAVGAERSVSRRFREAPLFLGLFTAQVLIGAAVALIPVNLIDLLVSMQILNGFITPVILVILFVLTSRPAVVGDAVNGPRLRVFAFVCVVAVSVLAVSVLGLTVAGWLGLA